MEAWTLVKSCDVFVTEGLQPEERNCLVEPRYRGVLAVKVWAQPLLSVLQRPLRRLAMDQVPPTRDRRAYRANRFQSVSSATAISISAAPRRFSSPLRTLI